MPPGLLDKRPWNSLTLWGILLMLIAFIGTGFFGFDLIPPDHDTTPIGAKFLGSTIIILEVVGTIMAIQGRLKAHEGISILR